MELLATLRAKDVEDDPQEFNYNSFTPRTATRAVVFDDNKVALIHVKVHGYYMLPGGGVDAGEDMTLGLRREIAEELGCDIKIISEVGSAEVYFDRWLKKQTDFCYIAHRKGPTSKTALTDFEMKEGHRIIWSENIRDAIRLVESASPVHRDGKLIRARDLLFLRHAQTSFNRKI